MNADRVRAWGDELREVHKRLRQALELAYESEDEAGSEPAGRDLLIYCWGFCVALQGHHVSEDGGLFPEILATHPELAPVIAQLSGDHSMIDHLVEELRLAMERGVPEDERIRHLDGIAALMESHFAYEERQLIDVLNASAIAGEKTALLGPIA